MQLDLVGIRSWQSSALELFKVLLSEVTHARAADFTLLLEGQESFPLLDPFGTLKQWMGPAHFLTRKLEK